MIAKSMKEVTERFSESFLHEMVFACGKGPSSSHIWPNAKRKVMHAKKDTPILSLMN